MLVGYHGFSEPAALPEIEVVAARLGDSRDLAAAIEAAEEWLGSADLDALLLAGSGPVSLALALAAAKAQVPTVFVAAEPESLTPAARICDRVATDPATAMASLLADA